MTFKKRPGYVKFTGDFSKLKKRGYKFQRLYAWNYMSWSKGDLIIWKRGTEICSGDHDLFKLISFLETNPQVKLYPKLNGMAIYKLYSDVKTNEYKYAPYNEESQKIYLDDIKKAVDGDFDDMKHHTSVCIDLDLIAEVNALGYELIYDF